MNFLITTNADYKNNFDLNKITHNKVDIFYDDNWTVGEHSLIKGTSNNYCKIEFKDSINITHNDLRDFPLFHDAVSCSNFIKLDNVVPADGKMLYDNGWQVKYAKDFYNIETPPSDHVKFVADILLENTKKFLDCNTLPILVPNNNGVDTLTARSILDYLQVPYELFDLKKLAYSNFHKELEKDYYGFNQIQEFDTPKVVLTGFYGDEFLLRNPYYVQSLIREEDCDLIDVFAVNNNCYMKKFFDLVYKEKCKNTKKQPLQKIYEMICNDQQVWHINNTMIWTPFKDKRLLSLLQCHQNVILEQVTEATLSKSLIEHFNSELLNQVDASKNETDPAWFWQADPLQEKFDYENNGRFEKDSKLYKASWLINNFAYALAPIRPADDKTVNDYVNSLKIEDLRQDINISALGKDVLKWINKSKRLHLQNVTQNNITLLGGIDYCIESLCQRSNKVGYLSDSYYGVKDYCIANNIDHYSIKEGITENSTVIIEFPTPNHNESDVLKFITDCKQKNCYIALDMTFLPVYIGKHLDLDLIGIDEIWFSMNKTWPINDIRPCLRYSNKQVPDMHTVSQDKNAHNKISANVLYSCINKFNFDYTYDAHINTVESICEQFAIAKTNNLWLAQRHNTVWTHMPSKYWNYDNFIGLHGLIENKSKYFW